MLGVRERCLRESHDSSSMAVDAAGSTLSALKQWASEFRGLCLDCPVGAVKLQTPLDDPRR